jgi:hypothetical protein
MGSRERSGRPLTVRGHATAVWVDLRAVLSSEPSSNQAAAPDGLLLDEPCAGGLSRWLRSAGGDWIGVVTYVARTADGKTFKAADQLVPARALRPR